MSIFRRITTIHVSRLANIGVLYHIISEKSTENEKYLLDLLLHPLCLYVVVMEGDKNFGNILFLFLRVSVFD